MKKTRIAYVAALALLLGRPASLLAEGLDDLTIVDDVVQIGSAEDFLNFAIAVNEGGSTLDAVLTQDIDLGSDREGEESGIMPEFTMVGGIVTEDGWTDLEKSAAWYEGTFDGQFHTVTFAKTKSEHTSWALFGLLKGTIRNLRVSGTIATGKNYNAGIVSTLNGGTVENCLCTVSINDGQTHGGISRVTLWENGGTIRGCVFAGSLSGTNCAGFTYGVGDNTVVENCLLLSFGADGGNKFLRNRGVCRDCFYLDTIETGDNRDGSVAVSDEELASGAICYQINGENTTDPAWRQTIGNPDITFGTGDIVYLVGRFKCDGITPSEDVAPAYTNTPGGKEIEPHTFVDGLCSVCETVIDEDYLTDGRFPIATAAQFLNFAKIVNKIDRSIDAVLTEDIDLDEVIGELPMVGYSGLVNNNLVVAPSGAYAGTFDGQGHTITYNKETDSDIWGLFGCLSGTIRNLQVAGTITTEHLYVSALSNTLDGGIIENCLCSVDINAQSGNGFHGGFSRVTTGAGGTIRSCIYSGSIVGQTVTNSAAIICFGERGTLVTNTFFTGSLDINTSNWKSNVISRGSSTCQDCYYVNSGGAVVNAGASQTTLEAVATGWACYMLNGGNMDSPVWRQAIGIDDLPVLSSDAPIVYGVEGIYANVTDLASLRAFISDIIDAEESFCEDIVCQASLTEEYSSLIESLSECEDIESLLSLVTDSLLPLKQHILSSAKAYAAYQQKVTETIDYIESHPEIQNVVRDELYEYLTVEAEPDDTYPEGTAPYILSELVLDEEQLAAQTEYIDAMVEKMLSFDPSPGMEISQLFTNAGFENGFNGWSGTVGTATGSVEGISMYAAECYGRTMDMQQTLTGLKDGVYELQINGAFRPAPLSDVYSTNYAAMFYLNDNMNYFQANIEDMVDIFDAVDGENCHLTGNRPDIEADWDGEAGYVLNRTESCCYAFQANRYQNSILVNVTDGSLTIRISMPGTGSQPEWLGFGGIKVYYRGTMEEAGDAMDGVLASQSARAYTMLNYYDPSSDFDCANYPNFSQALKDELQEAIDDVQTTTETAAKYALVEKFSRLFQDVYDCKQAYISLFMQIEHLYDFYTAMYGVLDDDELGEIIDLSDELSLAYMNGTFTAEQAREQYMNQFSWYRVNEDGVFQIDTPHDFLIFSALVNAGENQIDAVLTQDIDLEEVMDIFTMVGGSPSGIYVLGGTYAGTFDGHCHTITYHKVADSNSWGLFGNLSGTIRNLRVSGSITTDGFQYMAGLVNTLNGGSIRNCVCDVDIINESGSGFHGGISRVAINNGGGGEIVDCVYAGSITGETAQKCGGIICWTEFGTKVTSCFFAGRLDINLSGNTSYIIARNPGGGVFSNCYYLNETGVVNPNTTKVTEEQMTNGELCALLNGDAEPKQWMQPEDSPYPLPFALAYGSDDAIHAVPADTRSLSGDSNVIFDLSGRKLSHLNRPGIYIVGGKKVIISK